MFRTLFKYVIYDYCIGLAFDNLKKNFPAMQSRFFKGQQFQAIEFEVDDIWWGIEDVEVIHCDDDLLVLSYSSGEAHVPDNHIELTQFDNDSTWRHIGSYGDGTEDSVMIYDNTFGGTQIFPIEDMKDIDYV